MVTFCSYCGADQSNQPVGAVFGHWEARCPDCGLVADDERPELAPGGDEVEYSLAEWVPADRILIRNALAERGTPWRWESGPTLVVDDRDQLIVELILDDLESEAADPHTDDEDDEDDDDEEGGEAAQEAMGQLFVVADRLIRTPVNAILVDELEGLAEVVEDTAAPFGVDKLAWKKVRELARGVVDAADTADEEGIVESSRSLRDFLRAYV